TALAVLCNTQTIKKEIKWNSHCSTGCFSGKKMEGHDGFITLQCLRGRLLAERRASRVAKEEAQSMANKFVELEKKLKEETKMRDRAERKLKLLKKKLEYFNVSSTSWSKSHSSKKCEKCCGSSLCSVASRDSEANETKLVAVNLSLLENEVHSHNVEQEYVLLQTNNNPFTTKDCGSWLNGTSDPNNFFPPILAKTPNQSLDNLKNDENRLSLSSSKSLAKGYNSQGTDGSSSNPSSTQAFPKNI
ncbi:hypothetical protein CR513_30408, partial [Mucuna pruriens]